MSQYQLLDSGNCLKLERIGKYTFVRPSPYAVWEPNLDQSIWDEADITFVRETDKVGTWDNKPDIKDFIIEHGDIRFKIKLTSFGHIGLFPEQEENLDWIRNQVHLLKEKTNGEVKVLNLFGYTGGSTLAAAAAGAAATHIDAAKNVVDWARENASENNLSDKPIRWIVEDAGKFVEREIKRGNKYHGIILDPPSFGRGPQGQVFKIETDLMPMFKNLKQILEKDCFVLYSGHTPGFTRETLKNQLEYLNTNKKETEAGDMNVIDEQQRILPSGFYARFGI
jgi:23S rRNA (cytosine1962-C5)-methyltransferase